MQDYHAFAHTRIGQNHITGGKVCQDFSAYVKGEAYTIAIVSDGHGSADFVRSDRGSRFACKAATDAVCAFLEQIDIAALENVAAREQILYRLCSNILLRWNTLVDSDVADSPFTEEELETVSDTYAARYRAGQRCEHAYGATLLIAIVTADFFIGIRNGDGECVALWPDGRMDKPIPWNDRCSFNVCTSLCDADSIEEFRWVYTANPPAAVFIGSDGVDDSYAAEAELFHLYRSFCLEVIDNGMDAAAAEMAGFLPKLTERGSGDDVSIAGIVSRDVLRFVEVVLRASSIERQEEQKKAALERERLIGVRKLKEAEKRLTRTQQTQADIKKKLAALRQSENAFGQRIFREQPETPAETADQLQTLLTKTMDEIVSLQADVQQYADELAALQVDTITDDNDAESKPTPDIPADNMDSTDGTEPDATDGDL